MDFYFDFSVYLKVFELILMIYCGLYFSINLLFFKICYILFIVKSSSKERKVNSISAWPQNEGDEENSYRKIRRMLFR